MLHSGLVGKKIFEKPRANTVDLHAREAAGCSHLTVTSRGVSVIRLWTSARFDDRHIYKVKRSGHVTANMWGWVHLYGMGELTQIIGKFNSDQYLEILEEVMLPTVRAYALPYPERIIYMHDRCPVHTAHVIRRWFEDQRDVELLPWPMSKCITLRHPWITDLVEKKWDQAFVVVVVWAASETDTAVVVEGHPWLKSSHPNH
ncbi:hypothetical protein Pcinc_004920 [Petrolisthes cinctipes]|uniref:Transposase n=1 Tax=Petrolisthes cinctipes TaxID=88211 RepID=A0AAE1L103_PETCI|nr:hypothetical protein Pcinc_004920 [Petrolisthes cinctipes]